MNVENQVYDLVNATVGERDAWLSARYFRLERDAIIQKRLRRLFCVDAEGELTDTPYRDPLNDETRGLMVLANSGNGKSSLLKRTIRHLPTFTPADPDTPGNTLMVTVPPEATVKGLASLIASRLGYVTMNPRAPASEMWRVARHKCQECNIRLLVIDEAHHLMRPGSGRDVEGAVQTLKNLTQGSSPMAVIIAGVSKLQDAVMTDVETDRRFPKLKLDRIREGSKDAKMFARSIEICAGKLGIALPPCGTLADRILLAEKGEAGRSIMLAKAILRDAILDRQDLVTLPDAQAAFEELYGITPGASPFAEAKWSSLKPALEAGGWG